jgi:hypothetical protein
LLLPAIAGVALAADPITLQVRPLVAGRFEDGGWLGVTVSLTNNGSPVNGRIEATGQDGPVRRAVELPAGAHKQVTLLLRPSAFTRQVEVRFQTDSGTSLATGAADVKVLERSGANVALFGDAQGNLRAQLGSRGDGLPEPIGLAAADLPERPEPLAGLETIVWAGDSSTLTEAQRRALERWIAAGGDLIVIGGADWQARTAAFDDLLPVTDLASLDDAPFAGLATWSGSDLPAAAMHGTIAVGTLRPDAFALTREQDALLSTRSSGAGSVTFVGADLATGPFRDWPGATSFWSRLLPDDRLQQQFAGPGSVPQQQIDAQMSQALANLPALQVPPAELLLLVIGAYIVLIGPASYFVLRRWDRRELAWVTAPALVIAFSAGSYGIGASMKGSDIIVNEVSVVRTTSGASAASVSTYAGVFSPSRSTYDLTVRGDALISSLASVFDGSGQPVQRATEQGDPAHLRGLSVSVFGLQGIRADTMIAYRPALDVTWHDEGRQLTGRVTNVSDEPLTDVAVIAAGGGTKIGDLAAGASHEFTLSISPFDGSQASDRVYGFQGGELTGTDRQLQIQTRRQVIDSLVGVGAGFGKLGELPGAEAAAGPYVIGWHDDASPVSVEIDGQKVQRFSQAVEVVAGTPTLGPGKVELGPPDLHVSVVATDGDVINQDFATLLGNGMVEFRIALPLQAVGLHPSSAAILTAGDPGSLMFNQFNASNPLPPGYHVSAWNAADGAWVELGSPNTLSRFELPNPSDFIGPGDSLRVRIVGDSVPAEQGQTPVFASASLSGVLDR